MKTLSSFFIVLIMVMLLVDASPLAEEEPCWPALLEEAFGVRTPATGEDSAESEEYTPFDSRLGDLVDEDEYGLGYRFILTGPQLDITILMGPARSGLDVQRLALWLPKSGMLMVTHWDGSESRRSLDGKECYHILETVASTEIFSLPVRKSYLELGPAGLDGAALYAQRCIDGQETELRRSLMDSLPARVVAEMLLEVAMKETPADEK